MKLITEHATPPTEETEETKAPGTNGNGVHHPGEEKLPPKNSALKGLSSEEIVSERIQAVAKVARSAQKIPIGYELEKELIAEQQEEENSKEKKTSQYQQAKQQPTGKHVKRCKCSQCPPIKDMRGGHKKGCNCEMCLSKRDGVWMFVDKFGKLYEGKEQEPEPEKIKTEEVPGTSGHQQKSEQQGEQRPPPKDTMMKFLNALLRSAARVMKLREDDVLITAEQEIDITDLRPESAPVKRTWFGYYGLMTVTVFSNLFTARKKYE